MVKKNPSGQNLPTHHQLRAARACLGMSVQELAELSGLGANTVRRAEAPEGLISLTAVNRTRLFQVLESEGVTFLEDDGAGAGIRFKPSREA